MDIGLIDSIYEASFVPELWPALLERLGRLSDSVSGAVLVLPRSDPPRWKATALVHDALHEFSTTDAWRKSERAPYLLSNLPTGFLCAEDYLTPDQLARDSVQKSLRALGIGWQLGLLVPITAEDAVAFTFERWLAEGRHDPAAVQRLDDLRPHLARAGLIAVRLGLERAHTTVATLDAVGIPAAILHASGRVIAANRLFEQLSCVFRPSAFGGLALADRAADALLRRALTERHDSYAGVTRSIPVRDTAESGPLVVHLLPIKGAAHDIFSGASTLIAATAVGMDQGLPAPGLLQTLFDLSPLECRIAIAVASGLTLKATAAEIGIKLSTTRSYLEQIFRKTGTNQQSQLVSLLKSARPFGPGPLA